MIWLHNLEKRYGHEGKEKEVLRKTNLLIPTGLCVGVMGEKGSGKSTLIKLIAGAETPSSGEALMEGSFFWSGGVSAVLHPLLTVEQNIRFLCRLYSSDDREMHEMVERIVELAALEEFRTVIWKKVPSTHKSLLGYAAMIVLEVDNLLIDGSPAPKKAPHLVEGIREKIRRTTTMMVSNSTKILKEYCDAALIVHNRSIRYFDSVEEAIRYQKNERET